MIYFGLVSCASGNIVMLSYIRGGWLCGEAKGWESLSEGTRVDSFLLIAAHNHPLGNLVASVGWKTGSQHATCLVASAQVLCWPWAPEGCGEGCNYSCWSETWDSLWRGVAGFVTDRNLAGSIGFFVLVLNLSATTWRRIALCSHGMLKPYFRNSELKPCLVDY